MPVDEHPQRTRSIAIPRHIRLRVIRGGTCLEEATRLLVRSFSDQPHFIDLFPESDVRTRALPHLFTALLADAHQYGRIDTISSNGTLAGAVVWYPPGPCPAEHAAVGPRCSAFPAAGRAVPGRLIAPAPA